jgi:L-methionine (R)-S-oxide reductase
LSVMNSTHSVERTATGVKSYHELCTELSGLIGGNSNIVSNAANAAALIHNSLPDIDWVGFYFAKKKDLSLGPFQGSPAKPRVRIGEGTAGKAAESQETVLESASVADGGSELSVPLLNWGKLVGVLRVTSPIQERFSEEDCDGMESVAAVFLSALATDDLPDFEGMARTAEI